MAILLTIGPSGTHRVAQPLECTLSLTGNATKERALTEADAILLTDA